MKFDPLLLALIASVIFLVSVIIYDNRRKTQKGTRKQLEKLKKKNSKNHLYFLYRIYMATPLVRRYFIKMKNMLRATYPADEVALNTKVTKQMTRFLLISLGLLVAIFAFGGNDIAYILVGVLAVYIVFTNMVNNSDKKMQKELLDQLDTLISEVHTNFDDSKIPSVALMDAIEDMPYEIGLHAHIIHDIITSSSPDSEIERYVDTAPNKFLLLFAAILETIEEHGDKKLADGRSMMIKNLDYLKQELGVERNRIAKRQNAFMGKTYSVLIALFILKPIQLWSQGNMPETTAFYRGSFGTITLAIVMAVTFICYEAINILKDDPNEEGKDARFFKRISTIPIVQKYLTAHINHNYTKCQRLSDRLKATGDKNGINVFIVKRICMACLFFSVIIGLSFYSLGREKHILLHDFSTAYSSSIVPDEEYREEMRANSLFIAKYIKQGYTMADYERVVEENYAYNPMYKDIMADELSDRTEQYNNLYFRWWMLVLALAGSVFGYHLPYIMLLLKQNIMGLAREDEVSQFRTLVLILMHEDGMTVDKILEWMERFAHAFKPSITECIFYLSRNEEKALRDMREKEEGFAPFRRFVDALLSIDKVGIEAAFDGLESDREYYKDKRKEDNEAILRKCSNVASLLELVPVAVVIIIYLVLPLVTLALNMYNEMDFMSYM